MLAVSPLRNTSKDGKQGEMESFCTGAEEFPDFGEGSLLETIDFDDLFMGINDGDALPDLDMDPEILATVSRGEEFEMNTSATLEKAELDNGGKREEDKVSGLGSGSSISSKEDEIMSERDEAEIKPKSEGDTARKSSAEQAKNNNQGKRKVKVDWTPELHRRFVQAVEQLGVDKAVPSRILELMGINCLTRHNVASHLQKYRSHRKHLLAREVEAVSWGQKRYVAGGGGKRDGSPWLSPTIGFPPITPMYHQFRPLHVWGHPSMHQSLMHMWPKHLAHSPLPPPPPPAWAPQPAPDPSFWHHQCVPNEVTPGAPCFPQLPTPMRFPAPPVPGFPPQHAMYKADLGIGILTSGESGSHSQPVDFHPSKESIDAAIGDVLAKPWLPLPLGLKPPSNDSVMGALQREGVPKVPPSCSPVLEIHFYQ